jgi:hypothetical protein
MDIRCIGSGKDTLTLMLNSEQVVTIVIAEVPGWPQGLPFDRLHASDLIQKARLYFNMAERTQAPREMKA